MSGCLVLLILAAFGAIGLHAGGMFLLRAGTALADAGFRLMRTVAFAAIVLLAVSVLCQGC